MHARLYDEVRVLPDEGSAVNVYSERIWQRSRNLRPGDAVDAGELWLVAGNVGVKWGNSGKELSDIAFLTGVGTLKRDLADDITYIVRVRAK